LTWQTDDDIYFEKLQNPKDLIFCACNWTIRPLCVLRH